MENDKILNERIIVGDKVAIKSNLDLDKAFTLLTATLLKIKNEFTVKEISGLKIEPYSLCSISNKYISVDIPVEFLYKIPVDRSRELRDIPKFSKGDQVKILTSTCIVEGVSSPFFITSPGKYDENKNTYIYTLNNNLRIEEYYLELAEPTPTSDNECRKNDIIDDKLRWDLLPLSEIEDIVKVYSAGAKKYGPNRWQGLEDGYNRYKGALLRHLMEYEKGNIIDSDTGCHHLAQVAWNAIAMLYLDKQGNGLIGKKKEDRDAGVSE